MDREVRYYRGEVRMEGDATAPRLVGHAAVFNSFSDDLGGFKEIIRPGTFTRTLANNCDVRFLINHDDLPLARTSSGTLRLKEDDRGLSFDAQLDPTDPDVQRIIPKMKRGDLNEMSFAFNCLKDNWRTENGQQIRELHDVDLSDISIVTYPAYPAADVALRSLNAYRKSLDLPAIEAVGRELQLLELE